MAAAYSTKVAALVLLVGLTCACSMSSPLAPSSASTDLSLPFALNAASVVGTGTTAGHAVITAKVQNGLGNPIMGATVAFSTNVGTITPGTATTDKDGLAVATLTNSQSATVLVQIGALRSTLLVIAEPPPPDPRPATPPVLSPVQGPSYFVAITASATSVSVGQTVTFAALVSPLNGAVPVTSYQWDCLGDATQMVLTPTATCTYPMAGTITTSLLITGGGILSGGVQTITVK